MEFERRRGARGKEVERVELEGGWGPPEMEGGERRREGGEGRSGEGRVRSKYYRSPRVSVPPKSRVVSYYI